ncbi:MAG: IS110 family transposase [Caldilineaceae bacterium]
MAKRKKSAKKSLTNIQSLDVLEQINLNAAGLDLGSEEIYACVPPDRDEQSVRVFPTFTVDLHALADWLEACGIDTVAMESTGVYWIPIYNILEARGFEVYLVNARHLKNVSGRKTDILDCQWIQQLHTYGLLRASFRPPGEIRALRELARHRGNLIRYRSAHIQHMQKALEVMNIKLTEVVSDITGVTGLSIIRAIVVGERDPHKLASFRQSGCKRSEEEIAKALQGDYKPEQIFILRQALTQYDFYLHQIQECDNQMEEMYTALPPSDPDSRVSPPPKPKRGKPRKNEAHYDLATTLYQVVGVDLTAIDGLDALTVQTIITEIGLDVDAWPTVKHFTSWLSLAPHNEKSGGKVLRSRTQKTKNKANLAFRLAAQSLSRSQSANGAFYRRMRARHGPAKAITATAHKLARIVYFMVKNKTAYVDPGVAYYEQQHRDRTIRNLKRRAKALGLELVPIPVQATAVS